MSETPRKSAPLPPPAIGSLPPGESKDTKADRKPIASTPPPPPAAVTAAGGRDAPRAGGDQTASIPSVGPPASGRRKKSDKSDGLAAGTLVGGRYEICEQFGEGGVGLVYRANDRKLGREVAVKIMRAELTHHSALRPRFEQEAGALVALVHPNIVTINDYGLIGESPYIVMELLSGQTLRQELDRGAMAENRAFDVALQLLQGLSYAHAQGVAHRDLKPSNIFLQKFPTQPDVVKILDFGFVAFLHGEDGEKNDLAEQDMGFGTPSYMPPEQIRGEIAVPASDVYAVGLLLFEMLCGKKAFGGDLKTIVRAQMNDPLPALSDKQPRLQSSDELTAILAKATDKNPKKRYVDAAAMLRTLELLPRPATWTEAPESGRPSGETDVGDDVTHQIKLERTDLRTTAAGFTKAPPKTAGRGKWLAAAAGLLALGGAAYSLLPGGMGDARPGVAVAPAASVADEPKAEAQPAPPPQVAAAPQPEPTEAEAPNAVEPAGQADEAEGTKLDTWIPQGLTGNLENIGARLASGENIVPAAVKAARMQVTKNPDDIKRMVLLGRLLMARGRDTDALQWYRNALLKDEGVRGDALTRTHLLRLSHTGEQKQAAFRLAIRIYGKGGVSAVDAALEDTELRPGARKTLERLRTMMAAQK